MSNYSDVKNYIHNELGITKEYVNEVIEKTVKDEISKMMSDKDYIYGLVEKQVLNGLKRNSNNTWHILTDCSNWIEEEIKTTILKEVKDKLEIKLKED